MKIVAINGSHKGRDGNTDIMVSASLLEQTFIPPEIYIQEVKRYVDSILKK